MQKEKTSRKTLTQNVNIRTDGSTHGRTDEWTKRRKLYTPRHTSYAGGIIIGWQELEPSLVKDQICQKIITQLKSEGSLKLI